MIFVEKSKTSVTCCEDQEFPNERRNAFIAIVLGLSVIVSYALVRNVISFQISDDPTE